MSIKFYTLDELIASLILQIGSGFKVTWQEKSDGSSNHLATVDGVVRASWVGRLKNTVPIDGKTPRGPKEYYGLKFY